MVRKKHLEEQLAKDYELLKEYENTLRTEIDPRLKLKWREDIKEVKERIFEREEELRSLSAPSVQPKPVTPYPPPSEVTASPSPESEQEVKPSTQPPPSEVRDLRKNKISLLQPLLSGFNWMIGTLFKRKSLTAPPSPESEPEEVKEATTKPDKEEVKEATTKPESRKLRSERGVKYTQLPYLLAAQKWKEVELRSERGVDYTKLRDLLKQQKWKEADQETAKIILDAALLWTPLILTLQVTGRMVENVRFDNFPCKDLRTINQLWLHYSNSKFGFSVQTKILLKSIKSQKDAASRGYRSYDGVRKEGGGRLLAPVGDLLVWSDFCKRVGWTDSLADWAWSGVEQRATMPKGAHYHWADYLSSGPSGLMHMQPGHLPYAYLYQATQKYQVPTQCLFSSLVQRLVTCKILHAASQPPVRPEPLLTEPSPSKRVTPTPSPQSPEFVELRSERGVDYTKLRDLLAAGEWKKADQETGKVMCQAAGREQECWLHGHSIDNFPCEDLRTINQLWLYYSNEKFGFSVQKEIYENLGGTREYDEEVWTKFCDYIGWRKGGNWLNYSELTFNQAAPKAHLPWFGFVLADFAAVYRFGRRFSYLAQRLVTCKI